MTNKVILKKSFAGYPVGEYSQSGEYFYLNRPDEEYTIHKDIVEGMPSYFEEVKEEGRRMGLGRIYYRINHYGEIKDNIEEYHGLDDDRYSNGNYYLTEEAAQAVADLRKHVYKFPMYKKDERNYYYAKNPGKWVSTIEDWYNSYEPLLIHNSSTEEDRADRLRLINECIRLNGYLTI